MAASQPADEAGIDAKSQEKADAERQVDNVEHDRTPNNEPVGNVALAASAFDWEETPQP